MSMAFNFYDENNKLIMTLSLAEMEADNDAGQDGIDLIAEVSKLAPGERFAWGGGAEPLYEAVAVWQDVPKCDQCQMANINGVNCHETGCMNSKKTWVADQGWVLFLKCRECGCDVEEGAECCEIEADTRECYDVRCTLRADHTGPCEMDDDDDDDDEDEDDDQKPDNYVSILGGACEDCVSAIAYDDYSGMDDETEQRVRAAIKKIGQWLIVGEETGFTHRDCGVCGGLAGDRHEVGYLEEVAAHA